MAVRGHAACQHQRTDTVGGAGKRHIGLFDDTADHGGGIGCGEVGAVDLLALLLGGIDQKFVLGAGNGGKLWLKLGPEIPKAGSSVQNVNTGSAPTTPDATAKLPAGGK